MHLPAAITNALALANSALSSVGRASADSPSHVANMILSGIESMHLESVCSPAGAGTTMNLSFPCNQNNIIFEQCYYGRTFDEVWNMTVGDYSLNKSWTPQGPLNQRLCACEGHYFDTLAGCSACAKAHGAGVIPIDEAAVSSLSSSYCAASSTPTVGLGNLMKEYYNSPSVSSILSSELSKAKTSTYSDPLADSTAVSYYYTPSVTGTAVFNIAGVTHGAMPTETNVKHGQITAESGAGAIGSGLGRLKVAFAALLSLMAIAVLL